MTLSPSPVASEPAAVVTDQPAAAGSPPDLAAVMAKLDQVLGTVSEHGAKIKDITKGLGRVREKVKGAEHADQDSGGRVQSGGSDSEALQQASGLTHKDVQAILKLGQISATLPAEAQSHLEELQASGASFREALRVAEAMRLMMPAKGENFSSGTATVPAKINGASATQASRTAPSHPRSLSEFVELAKKDRPRFEALKNDPTFDPVTLPHAIK